VLLGLFVVAVIVVMGGLLVVVSRSLMMRSSVVVMLAGAVFLLFRHLKISFKNEVRLVAEQSARWGAITDFGGQDSAQ
jgi:hypothetical protein